MSIWQVAEFADKFELPREDEPCFPEEEHMLFRIRRQMEEGDELREAWKNEDLVGAFDALLDAAYIIYGTALRMGITPEMWQEGFDAVHSANMTKRRAQRAEESKYGLTYDIVKPADWVSPEETLAEILGAYSE